MRKLFKGGNYSREETICENTIAEYAVLRTGWADFLLLDGYFDFTRLHELYYLLSFTPV